MSTYHPPRPIRIQRQNEILALSKEETDLRQIAKKAGVTVFTVRQVLELHGFKSSAWTISPDPKLQLRKGLQKKILKIARSIESVNDIAEQAGVTPYTVQMVLKSYGYKRTAGKAPPDPTKEIFNWHDHGWAI